MSSTLVQMWTNFARQGKMYCMKILILSKKNRTGNPTPEDSPVSWDSVRPDQPKYLRIDREVYHHYKKAFIIIIRDKCDFDWQGSAFMELSPDYVERMNLWRDLIGDWPPVFPQVFHWPCIYVRYTESFPHLLLTLHICNGKFVFVSELITQIGLLEASTLCLRNNGGTT